MEHKEIKCVVLNWIHVFQNDHKQQQIYEHTEPPDSMKGREFLAS
jgi:hypothetical protein